MNFLHLNMTTGRRRPAGRDGGRLPPGASPSAKPAGRRPPSLPPSVPPAGGHDQQEITPSLHLPRERVILWPMRRTIVGVMGGNTASPAACAAAEELGRLIAEAGWVLLNGGKPSGIMDASARGARAAGGLTVGVLFDADPARASEHLDIVIPTGMGAARNVINVLASDAVVACEGNGGTLSEIAMALRFGKRVVLLGFDPGAAFLDRCGTGTWSLAATPREAVEQVKAWLERPTT